MHVEALVLSPNIECASSIALEGPRNVRFLLRNRMLPDFLTFFFSYEGGACTLQLCSISASGSHLAEHQFTTAAVQTLRSSALLVRFRVAPQRWELDGAPHGWLQCQDAVRERLGGWVGCCFFVFWRAADGRRLAATPDRRSVAAGRRPPDTGRGAVRFDVAGCLSGPAGIGFSRFELKGSRAAGSRRPAAGWPAAGVRAVSGA